MTHAGLSTRDWPRLPYQEWKETCSALHLWSQIAGKYRLAKTPWINHSWHATLYVSPQGLTTGPIPDDDRSIEIIFDLCDHRVVAQACGDSAGFGLESMSVADFLHRMKQTIAAVGGAPVFHGSPNEVVSAIPFAEDVQRRPYDARAVEAFHAAIVRIERVFQFFHTSFVGKVSPVHLFWGSFDLAVTRFSGRRAPLHPGGIPHLPDDVTREAYSHEVSSAGFWPGGSGADEAMFYSYAYPAPAGFSEAAVEPDEARWDAGLGEFVLPYAAVQSSDDPEAKLLSFLQSTYEAAAELGHWDRAALECELGRLRIPRAVEVAAPRAR